MSFDKARTLNERMFNMNYTELGKTGIKVSRICAGCMSYGRASEDFHLWTLPQEETTKMVAHALDLGVNFFDTANCYAHGTSEEFLGNALRAVGVKREDVIIASKVYFNDGKLSRSAIEREIAGTLTRLGTDYLDLYQIHRFDYDTPVEETMSALDALVKSGKVRALGASAMYGYQFHNLPFCPRPGGADGLYDEALRMRAEGKIRHISITNHTRGGAIRRFTHAVFAACRRTPHTSRMGQRHKARHDRQDPPPQI